MSASFQIKDLKNYLNGGNRSKPCTTIVVHATAGSTASGAIKTLVDRKLSYHYIIDKDGTVFKCRPVSKTAYHAGESFGPDGRWVNGYSIGISLANLNDGKDPYTEAQIESLITLINLLKPTQPIKWLTTHYWISPGRKTDPRGLDMNRIAKATQLPLWKG